MCRSCQVVHGTCGESHTVVINLKLCTTKCKQQQCGLSNNHRELKCETSIRCTRKHLINLLFPKSLCR